MKSASHQITNLHQHKKQKKKAENANGQQKNRGADAMELTLENQSGPVHF